jgi:hypothetical protein
MGLSYNGLLYLALNQEDQSSNLCKPTKVCRLSQVAEDGVQVSLTQVDYLTGLVAGRQFKYASLV